MHKALALLWCSSLVAGDLGTLQQLTDQHRFFELRRELDQPGWNAAEVLFYRALVACRFSHETEGIGLLKQALAAKLAPEMARRAYEEMASAFARLDRYGDAAQAWDQALLLTPAHDPEREGSENTRALMDALTGTPPESVELGEDSPVQASRNPVGSWNVPVDVNGVNGQWIFDTGANHSTLTEAEAKRMGLSLRETKVYVTGSTQKRNALQLAIASDVRVGAAHIHNVVFLVLEDQALHVAPLHYQITGILGLPALRALRRVEISSAGVMRVQARERTPEGAPNLYFDEASPIVEVDHSQHHLQMFLDTGANASILYRSALNAIGREEHLKLRTKREKVGGAGGIITRKTQFAPTLEIEVLGQRLILKNLSLLSETPPGNGRYRDGVIGMDALWSGFRLDFGAMRMQVQ
jgi:predicted aspartyl protease